MRILSHDKAQMLLDNKKPLFVFVNGEGYMPLSFTSRDLDECIARFEMFYPTTLPHDIVNIDGFWEWKALCHAEDIGIYSYTANPKKRTMTYYSYFGSEGFYKVVHHLDSGFEVRTHLNSTKHEYNHFVG